MSLRKEKTGVCSKSVHYGRTGLLLLFFVMLSTGLASSGFASDDVGSGPGKDRFKVYLGGYFPASNTNVKVDIGDNEIDLEKVLGLSDNSSIFRLDGYWRFAKKHRLAFAYYSLNRDTSKYLEDTFNFDDKEWTVGALVATDLSLDFYQIKYLYSFFQGEKWEIAGSLGGYWVKADLDVFAAASVNNATIVGQQTSESVEGPLPLIGLTFDYYITPKWLATVKGGYFQLSIDDIDGKLANIGASVEYQLTKYFGLGLGYDYFEIEVKSDSSGDVDISKIDYKYHGAQVFGILRF
jgi:hypothetical protein